MILARLHMVKDAVNAESREGKLLGARMGTFTGVCVCVSVCLWICCLSEERFGNLSKRLFLKRTNGSFSSSRGSNDSCVDGTGMQSYTGGQVKIKVMYVWLCVRVYIHDQSKVRTHLVQLFNKFLHRKSILKTSSI